MNLRRIFNFLILTFGCHIILANGQTFSFDCKRAEKDYVEEYEMELSLASGTHKAKIFLDGRDLDQSDDLGKQEVKSIVMARPNIVITIEASFEPEEIMNVAYPAGKVSTLITLDPISGKLKKVEKIQGGILGASLGNGTHVSEEVCLLSKMPYKTKEQPK